MKFKKVFKYYVNNELNQKVINYNLSLEELKKQEEKLKCLGYKSNKKGVYFKNKDEIYVKVKFSKI